MIIGVISIVFGIILIMVFIWTLKVYQICLGIFLFFAGIGLCIPPPKVDNIYFYKTSEYKVEITYEIKQKGDQIICDTIYEFKKK